MATPRQRRAAIKRRRSDGDIKLNITSMMDMFTIILVFLLKSYSTEGQLVTPAEGLHLPNSTVQKSAKQGLEIKVSQNGVMVENRRILSQKQIGKILKQDEYLIRSLHQILVNYSEEARATAETYGQEFKGSVTLQGDKEILYSLLVKLMYTCGQAGFPNINLIVYKGGE